MTDVQSILQNYWGYENFRPLQKEIIESVLFGRDTLAVLPTGGGKSICFQVPALATEGICLVISPLIALMKDQVENLKKRSIPALLIHSGMQRADVIKTLQNATHSYFRFLYISPERLETFLFKEYLPSLNINLIAVDEAHCISQWGYDFRPSYLRIADLRKELPDVPVLALTASATEDVQKDICDKLSPFQKGVKKEFDWYVFRQSFERKNLSYSVFKEDSKTGKLIDILTKVPGTAIVYCKSRKRTQQIASLLQQHEISAAPYHAGLKQEERNARQQDWISNKVRVMVCTNAFGMGIDKPDVRTVVHLDTPDCLENYYQEAGRAGRDGKKSYAVLLYSKRDVSQLAELHLTRYPALEQIKAVYNALVNYLQVPVYTGQDKSFPFRFDEFIRNFKLNSSEALYSIKALEQDGWLDFNERNQSPSTLVFITSKQGLYAFQKSYPQHEHLLTTLLRTYEGIFDFPVFISENFLSRLLKQKEADIKLQLKTIAAFGIIQYLPQTDEPQIIFRKHRVQAEDLSFNQAQYQKRRDVFTHRATQMIEYIETASCRSQFISRYFGEAKARACGVCDNCLQQKKSPLSSEDFDKIASLILSHISQNHLTADALLEQLKSVQKEKAWKVLSHLQAEKKIKAAANGVLMVC